MNNYQTPQERITARGYNPDRVLRLLFYLAAQNACASEGHKCGYEVRENRSGLRESQLLIKLKSENKK